MAKKPVKAETIEVYKGDTEVTVAEEPFTLPTPISQAECDYAVLKEAHKIKCDSKRLMAARAIGHVPV